MTPVEITQGKSFKGLSQYLLHDEKREGEQSRTTSERVGWVQTFNLNDAYGDQAWRLMLATANSADALKEAAGIKKGKAVKNTVYHYSINFHPDDELTEEIQRKAVEGSLAALGLENHQALAVEHTDKAHNHIHIMVNLIDPENGMSAATPRLMENGKKSSKLSNSRRKLSSWAAKFERDNGLKITEGRLANANKRNQGQEIDARRKPRNVHEREKREATTDRRRDFLKRQHTDRAKQIQDHTRELKEQHAFEWTALKEGYAAEKSAIKDRMSPQMKFRAAEVKAEFKPEWAKLFKRHDQERDAFDRADRTVMGAIWHGAAVFKELAIDGNTLGGFLAAFMKEERRAIILRKHDRERQELGQQVGKVIAGEMQQMKADFDRQFTQAREGFMTRCSGLKTSQDEAWAEVREAWREYNTARSAAFTQARSRQADMSRREQLARGRGREPS